MFGLLFQHGCGILASFQHSILFTVYQVMNFSYCTLNIQLLLLLVEVIQLFVEQGIPE